MKGYVMTVLEYGAAELDGRPAFTGVKWAC